MKRLGGFFVAVVAAVSLVVSGFYTTLNISNWSQQKNDKYMRLVMSSGLRIITLDDPHGALHKGSAFEGEMKLLRARGYKIVKLNPYMWEWRR